MDFFIDAKGKSTLVAHENLPQALAKNDCKHLNKGGCWCVSRYRNNELMKASNIIECQRIESAMGDSDDDTGGLHITQQCHCNLDRSASVF